jgi:hypothetical protein
MKNAKLRNAWARMCRHGRMTARLDNAGLAHAPHRHLDRVSNVTFRGERMHDGTCHYTNRMEFSGNTYEFRGMFREHGLTWDGARKCWWLPYAGTFRCPSHAKYEALLTAICRKLAK